LREEFNSYTPHTSNVISINEVR